MKYEKITDLMTAICDSVRKKTKKTEKISSQDIPEMIENIPDSREPELDELYVVQNGTYVAEDELLDGFSVVKVEVPEKESKTIIKKYARFSDETIYFNSLLTDANSGNYMVMNNTFGICPSSVSSMIINFLTSNANIISSNSMMTGFTLTVPSTTDTINVNLNLTDCIDCENMFSEMGISSSSDVTLNLSNITMPENIPVSLSGFLNGISCNKLDLSNLIKNNTKSLCKFLSNSSVNEITGCETWDTSGVEDFSYMLSNSIISNDIIQYIVDNLDFSNSTNISFMFYGCKNINNLDLSNMNIEKQIDLYMNILYGCTNLETVILPDLTNIMTSNISFLPTSSTLKNITFKQGTTFGNSSYSTVIFSMNKVWMGSEFNQYFDAFADSLGMNTSGKTRTIKFYTVFYNSLTDEQKTKLTDKGYTISYSS